MSYLRVSLTDRCNLRCKYCLPEDARFAPDRASGAELRQLTSLIHTAEPLHKIRLTGGEPTLAPDLLEHLRHARSLVGANVGLTTNGVGVADRLHSYQQAGMNFCNISIDAADAADFAAMTRRDQFSSVVASIRAAAELDGVMVKLNAVAIKGFTKPGALLQFAIDHHAHLRFIEVMAIGPGNDLKTDAWYGAADIQTQLWNEGWSLTATPHRDEATSRVWQIDRVDPQKTTLGFITTSSEPFCGTCDRLRLSSQGTLHTCLFDERGIDLLTPLRAGQEDNVIALVQAAVQAKRPHTPQIKMVMASIGG
jgi:cyclic pyranopterin phosphate synthase